VKSWAEYKCYGATVLECCRYVLICSLHIWCTFVHSFSMPQSSPLLSQSYALAINTVKFCHTIQKERREFILTKQLIRSATSVGANIVEAQRPQSRRDFIAKIAIALKEGYETRYWIRLLCDADLCSLSNANLILTQVDAVIAMLVASSKTAIRNLSKPL
jgi:four helix bundle protein